MTITRLSSTDQKSPAMDDLVGIYQEAITLSEQKPRPELEAMLENSEYYLYVMTDHDDTVGFAILYAPQDAEYCLLEYMAVVAGLRNKGYGGTLFSALTEIFRDRAMVIEIESPEQPSEDQKIRAKRMDFYRRHGSVHIKGMHYILPLEANGTPPDMFLLLHSGRYRGSLPKARLSVWIKDIYTGVYACNASDSRIATMLNPLPDKVPLV